METHKDSSEKVQVSECNFYMLLVIRNCNRMVK